MGGVSPQVVGTVLDLSHSVHPHGFSASSLYEEALVELLSAPCGADEASREGRLEVIMSSVSCHESKG